VGAESDEALDVVEPPLEPLPEAPEPSSDGVEHAASNIAAQKVVTKEKRIVCPLKHIPGIYGLRPICHR